MEKEFFMSMRLKIYALFIPQTFVCWANPATPTHPSLFYEEHHVKKIWEMRSKDTRNHQDTNPSPTYRLNGIMFTSPASWRLWINGIPYNQTHFPGLMVTRVSANDVSFTLHTKGTSHVFTLKVNQSYTPPPQERKEPSS